MRPFKQKAPCPDCRHVHAGKSEEGRCPQCACELVMVEDLDDEGLQQLADIGVQVPGFKPRLKQ